MIKPLTTRLKITDKRQPHQRVFQSFGFMDSANLNQMLITFQPHLLTF